MLTRTIFIYSVTYKVNLFGKVFAHVRNCLRKEKHMHGTNKNIDGFYTKTTQIWEFRVKIKKSVIPTYSIFQHVYGKHNLVSFYGRIVFWQKNCIVVFYIILGFFQEETLGDISFKFETKIMNFMTGFVFEKNIIKLKCCQYYALQFVYNFPIIRPLCRVWVCFYWLHHVFQILSVILANYHYNIYWLPQIQFHIYIS